MCESQGVARGGWSDLELINTLCRCFETTLVSLYILSCVDRNKIRSNLDKTVACHTSLRWTETKNLKILIIDNFFSCHLMVVKLCTVLELGNTKLKLKLEFF